jgi:hypothetical protein
MKTAHRQFERDMKTAIAHQIMSATARATAAVAVYCYYGIASAGPA